MKLWKSILASLLLPFAVSALPNSIDQAYTEPVNILLNPGFESGVAQWATSPGTLAIVSSGANLAFGNASGAWTPSAGGQTLVSTLQTIPNILLGNTGCGLTFFYKGGSANISVSVLDQTSSLIAGPSTLSTQAHYTPLNLFFTCPTSGQLQVSFSSSAASATVYLDQLSLGARSNSIIQASLLPSNFPLLAPDGTAAAPSYSFANGSSNGLYEPAGNPAMSVSNSKVMEWDSSFTHAYTPLIENDGSVSAPAYSFNTTNYGLFYLLGLHFAANGLDAGGIDSTGAWSLAPIGTTAQKVTVNGILGVTKTIIASDGTAAVPSYSFAGGPSNGLYQSSGVPAMSVSNSKTMEWDSSFTHTYVPFIAANGTVTDPSYSFNSTNYGIFFLSGLHFAANGVDAGSYDANGAWTFAPSGTTTQKVSVNGSVGATKSFYASDGTRAAPAYSFTGSTSNGLYQNTGVPTMSVSNTDIEQWNASFIDTFKPIYAPDGTALAPSYSFQSDTTSGFYIRGAGNPAITSGNFLNADFTSSLDTFHTSIAATNFSGSSSGTNTGDVTLGTAHGLSLSGQQLSLQYATNSLDGALSSTDWNTFNNKQVAGNYLTGLNTDVVATGPGTVAATVADFMNRRYVDFLSGNDSTGTGTVLRPWKTLQHACNSISPTINRPYAIFLSGGNNDTDVGTITCPPNLTVSSDYTIQIGVPITITGGATNDGVTFNNIIFVGALTWTRNDASAIGMTLINSQFFSGPVFKQNGAGSAALVCQGSVLVNADLLLPGTGSFFNNCSFLGATTTFGDASAAAYYVLQSGYNSSNIHVSGGAELYLSGVQCDEPFGCGLTGTTTANGTPLIQTDSGSIPASISGAFTINLISHAQHEAYVPAVSGNWLSVPSNVASALDSLAGDKFNSDGSRTLTGPLTESQQSTPANPSAGSNKLYFKADNNLYMKNSAGVETLISTGSITTGNLTEATSSILTITGGSGAVVGSGTSIQVSQSGAASSGYLSSTDWNTFNNKQVAGNYITALTSDVSATGPGSVAATVNSVGGSSAANVHSAELLANAATSSNTASAIVKRGASGEFSAGAITADSINLVGSAPPADGAYLPATNSLGFSAGSTAGPTMTLNSGTVQTRLPDGAVNQPALAFSSGASDGFFKASSTAHGFVNNGSADFKFFIEGNSTNGGANLLLASPLTTTKDQWITFQEGTVAETADAATIWSVGRDDSDSAKFKISQNATLGTKDYFKLDNLGNLVLTATDPSDAVPVFSLDLESTLSGDTPQGNHFHAINVNFNRTLLVNDTTDTSGMMAVSLNPSFTVPTGKTLTNSSTAGFAGLLIDAPALATGALAFSNYHGIRVNANSVATGSGKVGIEIQAQTGATNNTNLLIGTGTQPTGQFEIYSAGTNPSSFAGSLTGTAFIPSGSTVPSNGMYLSGANTLNFATNTTLAATVSSSQNWTFAGTIAASNFSGSSSGTNTGDQTITLTGDVTGSGTGTFAASVAKIAGTTVSGTTGTTNVVFSSAPSIVGGSHTAITSLGIRDTSAAFDVTLAATSSTALTAGRTITIDVKNAARAFNLQGDLTVSAAATISGTNTGDVTLVNSTNGLTISGQALTMALAAHNASGTVSSTTQTFTGDKTVEGILTANSLVPTSSTVATNGMYLSAANTVAFSTNSTLAGTINSSQRWDIGPSGYTGLQVINGKLVVQASAANPGNTSTATFINNDTTSGTAHSTLLIQSTATGTAADSSIWLNTLGNTSWAIGISGPSGSLNFVQAAHASGGTPAMSINNTDNVTIQSGTTHTLSLNNVLATNGAQTATMTNLPAAATAGNPAGWLSINVNGTTSYIPFWH